jgi:transposase-like protein
MGEAAYSQAFKTKIVEKLLRPGGPSATRLAREVGISQPTLSRWKREAGSLASMKKKTKQATRQQKKKDKGKGKRWSAKDKLRIVMQAAELSAEELGGFLRSEGVHSRQLEQWREAVHAAFGERTPESRRRAQADRKRIQQLERELHRKEKALAEAAALVWLKKKAQEIWGDEDDDTPRKNGK